MVETPAGKRRWGDLGVGDLLFGSDGAPTPILQTHHFKDVPMYRVTFDDGSFLDVSSGHLWNVRGRSERRNKRDTWRTLETIELLELGVKRLNGVALSRTWEIPIQGAVQFEEREIDLHPYVMGIWIGDGNRNQPKYTKPFPEIARRLKALDMTGNGDEKSLITSFQGGVFDCRFRTIRLDEYKYNLETEWRCWKGCDSDGEVHASGSIDTRQASVLPTTL
jgi:hypothetical protein